MFTTTVITKTMVTALIGMATASAAPGIPVATATIPEAQPKPASIPVLIDSGAVSGNEIEVIRPSYTIESTLFAYSSTPDQTNGNPNITASGMHVKSGIVANNCLPFGTELEINGSTYIVQDRMHSRYGCNKFDIWFPSRAEAIQFGKQYKTVTVFE